MDFHARFSNEKKIYITKFFLYYFFLLLVLVIVFLSIGFALDLSLNVKSQIQFKYGNSVINDPIYVREIINYALIKFITIVIFSISFCIVLWLGVKRVAYGYVFTIIYLVIFSFFFAYTFILELKAFWYDWLQKTLFMFLIFGLLLWGLKQRYHRMVLKEKLLQKQNSSSL